LDAVNLLASFSQAVDGVRLPIAKKKLVKGIVLCLRSLLSIPAIS
jgi:hypothetical protein